MSDRAMSRDEFDIFRLQIVMAEVRAGLRCPSCLQRACSVEYGDFECRGPRPAERTQAPDTRYEVTSPHPIGKAHT